MGKLSKAFVLVLAVLVGFVPAAMAATSSVQVSVNANVQSALTLNAAIVQNDGGVTSNVASMNFGQLTPTGFGGLSSTRFFTVYLTASTQTLPYTITQTGTALTAGSATIPAGASKVTPVYAATDNGGAAIPSGASLGTAGTWVASNKTIYTSESSNAQQRTIQAIYGLQSDPTLGAGNFVPSSQAAGGYAGTITYTVTA